MLYKNLIDIYIILYCMVILTLKYSAHKKLHFWKICQNYISKYLDD